MSCGLRTFVQFFGFSLDGLGRGVYLCWGALLDSYHLIPDAGGNGGGLGPRRNPPHLWSLLFALFVCLACILLGVFVGNRLLEERLLDSAVFWGFPMGEVYILKGGYDWITHSVTSLEHHVGFAM